MLAAARGDSVAKRQAFAEARRGTHSPYQSAISALRYVEDVGTSLELLRISRGKDSPQGQLPVQIELAKANVAAGRWQAAQVHLDSVARFDPVVGLLMRGHCVTLPFLNLPATELDAVRQDLLAWTPGEPSAHPSQALDQSLLPHAREYLLGLIAAKLGDTDAALRHASALDRMPHRPMADAVVGAMAATIRADAQLRAGGTAQAVALLERVNGEVPLELTPSPGGPLSNAVMYIVGQEHARYLRALALQHLGRDDEARRLWETAFAETPSEVMYLMPSLRHLGEIHERQGRLQQAHEHYSRAARLWEAAEPPLAAERIELARRLAALSTDRS